MNREEYIKLAKNYSKIINERFGSYGYPIGEKSTQPLKEEWAVRYIELVKLLDRGSVAEAIELEPKLTKWIKSENELIVSAKIALHTVVKYIWKERLESKFSVYFNNNESVRDYIVKYNPRKKPYVFTKSSERGSMYSRQFGKGDR